MKPSRLTRRQFVAATSVGTVATVAGATAAKASVRRAPSPLAVHGGKPVRSAGFSRWPLWDRQHDEAQVLEVLRSGVWSRSHVVAEFEKRYAELIGTKRCLATTNGTMALVTALNALEIGVGDEVLVGPYTFVATLDAIFLAGALPIMVDTDPETFQVNPDRMEAKITPRTRAILPVHIYGLPADMDRINALARKHDLLVVEDACQAWLAEWKGKKCGALGDLGCFSFQNSKHLTCGEGGALLGDDDRVMNRAFSYHDFGRPYQETERWPSGNVRLGTKCRMAEFQAAILLAQMTRLEEQTRRRWENANYLTSKLQGIPGITPHKLYDGVTRAAYHIYPLRYHEDEFGGVSRARFLEALRAEGIPCSGGYGRLNREPFFENTLNSRNFQRMYSRAQLDHCREMNECPDNDALCEQAVCLFQNLLLGTREDMDDIADAVVKVYEHREQLA